MRCGSGVGVRRGGSEGMGWVGEEWGMKWGGVMVVLGWDNGWEGCGWCGWDEDGDVAGME